jgi:hypothetical protein
MLIEPVILVPYLSTSKPQGKDNIIEGNTATLIRNPASVWEILKVSINIPRIGGILKMITA